MAVAEIRKALPSSVIEARFDAAFFQEEIIKYLLNEKIEFAMKVPMWQWLNLKQIQLDFFTPDDGYYEHSVILSNRQISAESLLEFYNGRANMEHEIAEIKGEFGFDVIPCRDYQGTGAHQQISLLAFNLMRNFQLDLLNRNARSKTASRTNLFEFESLKSLRFEMITAAGRLLNVSRIKALRLSQSTMRRKMFEKVEASLDHLESRKKRAA